MKNLGKWMLGAAIVASGLGLGATSAQAAEFRVVIGRPAAYIPPCPGPGYEWVAGYYNGGYWVPGYWNNVGMAYGYDRDRSVVVARDRDFYRDRSFNRDRDDRHSDRDEHRGHDGDHFRR